MPHYKWVGIDLDGNIHHGYEYAQSTETLNALLLKKEIGLIRTYRTRRNLLSRSLSPMNSIEFLSNLALLLESGVHITHALSVLAQQTSNQRLKEVIYDISFDIESGISLSDAMHKFSQAFNKSCICMVQAGQESGSLSTALFQFCNYQETIHAMRKKLRSAAMVPLITSIVFLVIALLIFIFVIPAFEHILQINKQPIPHATQMLFDISKFITSSAFLWWGMGAVVMAFAVRLLSKTDSGTRLKNRAILHIPFANQIVKNSILVTFLRTLALLVQGGVHLPIALSIAGNTTDNQFINKEIDTALQKVNAGQPLSTALHETNSWLFNSDLISLIIVGQESSKLGLILSKAADLYYQKLRNQLTILTTIFQPLLIVLLGLLIAALIVAIYLPIFSLSELITF